MHTLPPTNSFFKKSLATGSNCFLFSRKLLNVVVAFFSIGLLVNFTACTPVKNTTYFQDLQKDTTLGNLVSKDFETVIRKTDLLSIAVASLSPDVAFYNAPQSSSGALNGYLVDEAGNIPFIKLGVLHVAGMTKKELKAKLEHDLVPYLKDVVVSVGILNRHITMIGAAGPQVMPITTENMTIIDALASSGDIGEKGKTDNILVIREKGEGEKEFKHLDLTNKSIFYSPYFYVQPNDIVYVEPAKVKTAKTAQVISYITAGVSFILLILNQFFK